MNENDTEKKDEHSNISLGKITCPSLLVATAHFWTNALYGRKLYAHSTTEYLCS